MSNRKLSLVVILILVIAVLVSSVYIFRQSKQSEEIVKVGAILPLTGPASLPGNLVKNGLELGFADGASITKGTKVQLIIEDSKNEPKEGVSALNKLCDIEKVDIVVSALSSVTMAVIPIIEEKQTPLMVTLVTYPAITAKGKWIFRHFINNAEEAKLMAIFSFKKMGIKNIGIFYSNDEGGLGSKQEFMDAYKEFGGNIVFDDIFNVTESNFRNLISKRKTAQIQGLYVIGYGKALGLLIKQIAEQGVRVPIFSMAQFGSQDSQAAAGDAADGVIYTAPAFSYLNSPIKQHFSDSYQKQFGTRPNFISAYAYDVAQLISRALVISKEDKIDLKNSLYKISNFEGTTGILTVSKTGEIISDLMVVQWKQGKEVYRYSSRDQ